MLGILTAKKRYSMIYIFSCQLGKSGMELNAKELFYQKKILISLIVLKIRIKYSIDRFIEGEQTNEMRAKPCLLA